MDIHKSDDTLLLSVSVDDSSYRYRSIMGDHNLTLYFSLAEHVEIPVGSYVVYQNQRYTLTQPEALKMIHTRYFEYTILFEAYQACAKRWKFRNPVDGRLKFPLTAKPHEHLQMFVDNMNRRDTGWTLGSCISGAEHLISYNHAYCLDALKQMASEFDTEYEIEGKQVSLKKIEYNKDTPLSLSYGKGNGFRSGIKRENSKDTIPTEILFTQGGTRNINPSTYGNKELLLPKNQTIGFDGAHFEDEVGYDSTHARHYIASSDGLSIQRSDKPLSSYAEDSLDCSDIYPKRIGTVGQVVVVDANQHFYDFIDLNDPSNPCPNYEDYLIEGETMSVIFQSGMLAGRELEVKYYHNSVQQRGETKLPRRFEIVPQEIDGITMPDDTFKPVPGDTFVIFHCSLPQQYIRDNTSKSGAEWEMFRTAVKYLYENEEQKFTFTGELDGIWAKKDWVNIGGKIILGGYIRFTDARFQADPVLIRITAIKDYINNPHSPEITISNELAVGGFLSEFKKVKADTEVIPEENYTRSEQFTKRRFRDAQETTKMLEKAMFDGFTQSVNPIAVQTMQLLVGDESLQYRFVDDHTSTNPTILYPNFYFHPDTGKFSADGNCYLQHLTLGISLSNSHAQNAYQWWRVTPYESSVLDDKDKKYYLYLKCPQKGKDIPDEDVCQYILSEEAIKMHSLENYYFLLVGVLNSEYEGTRSFSQLYGFTEILGGRITTDKIISSDGNTYFDLAKGEIGGKIVFVDAQGQTKTLISGGKISNDAIDTDTLVVKNVYSKDGNFQILADGTISGTLTDAEYLRIRPKTLLVDDYIGMPNIDLINYNSVGIRRYNASIYTYNSSVLDWSEKSLGRTVVIEQMPAGGGDYGNNSSRIQINAPTSGNVNFYLENGQRIPSIDIRGSERLTLYGCYFSNAFYTWEVVKRERVHPMAKYGRGLKALAMGIVIAAGTFGYYYTFDNSTLSVSKISTGNYRIYFDRNKTKNWIYNANDVFVIATPFNSNTYPVFAPYDGVTDEYFDIATMLNGAFTDGNFVFMLYNLGDWM